MKEITILIATGNPNKAREFREILSDYAASHPSLPPIRLLTSADVGFSGEIEENGASFEENALIKARALSSYGYIAIADDSGLAVDALGGAPGIYSARYSGKGDAENNEKLLAELADREDRTARYVCAVACVFPDGDSFTVTESCEGRILREYRGRGGFGYDPLFFADDLGKTFGEATPEEKDGVSHRGRAVRAFARAFYDRLSAASRPAKKAPVLTPSQRAFLRSLAQTLDPVFQIGKGGVTGETVRQISNALEARELIKVTVLETSGMTAAEALAELAERTGAAPVQAIGRKAVLYRPSEKHKKIELKNR